MNAVRRALVLAVALFVAVPAMAADWTLGGGTVKFSTPDDWVTLMQSQGDPELIVFQVPDPSPTGQNTLARIGVTVEPASSAAQFSRFISAARTHARTLTGYKLDEDTGRDDQLIYTARENNVSQIYVERYFRKKGHAVMLRCIRPQHTEAGRAWTERFDRNCEAIARQLR